MFLSSNDGEVPKNKTTENRRINFMIILKRSCIEWRYYRKVNGATYTRRIHNFWDYFTQVSSVCYCRLFFFLLLMKCVTANVNICTSNNNRGNIKRKNVLRQIDNDFFLFCVVQVYFVCHAVHAVVNICKFCIFVLNMEELQVQVSCHQIGSITISRQRRQRQHKIVYFIINYR